MEYDFRWNDYNRAKIDKHGLDEAGVERVVNGAPRPLIDRLGEKWRVFGRVGASRWIQVVYVSDNERKRLRQRR